MGQMNCKGCNNQINYVKEEKKAYNPDGSEHKCQEFKKLFADKPKGFPQKWTKKEFKPIEGELEMAAIKERIMGLESLVEKHDDAIRALVKEVSFKTGSEVSKELAEDAMAEKPQPRPKDE